MRRMAQTIFVLLPITLCSCAAPTAHMNVVTPTKSDQYAWDGLGRDPNRTHISARASRFSSAYADEGNNKREQVLATLRPYSTAWWIVHDEIESDLDSQLSRKLVICHRCLPTDVVGSIPAN
jgi:hypothetical protein